MLKSKLITDHRKV